MVWCPFLLIIYVGYGWIFNWIFSSFWVVFSCIFFFLRFYLLILQKERAGGRAERDSQANSTLSTEPDVGLSLTTLRSWPESQSEVRCSTDSTTQVPLFACILHACLVTCYLFIGWIFQQDIHQYLCSFAFQKSTECRTFCFIQVSQDCEFVLRMLWFSFINFVIQYSHWSCFLSGVLLSFYILFVPSFT